MVKVVLMDEPFMSSTGNILCSKALPRYDKEDWVGIGQP
jgi:hypothetical protein